MKQRSRIYYTETDKALMWDRWQKGESLDSIARHFGRNNSTIQVYWREPVGYDGYSGHTLVDENFLQTKANCSFLGYS